MSETSYYIAVQKSPMMAEDVPMTQAEKEKLSRIRRQASFVNSIISWTGGSLVILLLGTVLLSAFYTMYHHPRVLIPAGIGLIGSVLVCLVESRIRSKQEQRVGRFIAPIFAREEDVKNRAWNEGREYIEPEERLSERNSS